MDQHAALVSLPLVSIIMRTVGGRPREIRRAIASVAANSWNPIEVLVVYQGSTDEQLNDLQSLSEEFPSLIVRIVRNFGTGDRRAENLNIGWEAAEGRYIGFLDDDDTLEPEHVALLVRAIDSSSRVWAYSQVVLRKEDEALQIVSESRPFRRHHFSLKSLWAENFLPIHSFLIDRTRLLPVLQHRPFHEALDRSEDWDFLLRLAFYHEPAEVDIFTCNYHVSTGRRNTNSSLMTNISDVESEQRNKEAWARCKVIVEQRKEELIAPLWWACDYLSPIVTDPAESGSPLPLQAIRLHQRMIRKLIRILERLL